MNFVSRLKTRLYLLLEDLNSSRRLEMRYLKRQMRRHLNRPSRAQGVDIACGLGNLTETVARTAASHVVGIDCNNDSIGIAHAELHSDTMDFVPADSHFLPFKSASADFATSICAFEHFDDDRKAMAEVSRVLKPGAFFFLTVDSLTHPDIDDTFRRKHARACHVHQYYSDPDIRAKLEAADLEVVDSNYLLKGRISRSLAHYGVRKDFGTPYLLLSALLYPLVTLEEFFAQRTHGYKLGITARKATEGDSIRHAA
jgi:ubiquinone/menaquinone biosynthesis C-methylase UbiE